MDMMNRWPEPRRNRLSQYFAELEEASTEYWGMHGMPSALVDELEGDRQDEHRDLFGEEEGGDR